MLAGARLLALLMTGAPIIASTGGVAEADGDGGPADLPEDDSAEDTGGGSSAVAGPDDPSEAPPPTDYEFVLRSGGDHSVAGFGPETDTLTLTSETWDFELYDLGHDGDGPALEIVLDEIRSVLRFPGLDMLPVDNVYLHVAEAGQAPQLIALRDALAPEEDDVLTPTDPDAPDALPDDPSDDPPLAPSDPDTPDAPLPPVDPGDVLAPTDPDAPET